MKIIQGLVMSVVILFVCLSSHAITNTAIAASGTNVILSWPSYGYETYLIQSSPDLLSDSWTNLVNAYPANSTSFTTFTNYGVLTPIAFTNSSTGGSGGIPPSPGGTNSGSGGTNASLPPAQTGYYRVFHIPDWLATFDGYQFDGPTFIPVDFAAPDAPTNLVESATVLINGQPTDNAEFTSDVINGATYWGMGIYFDRLPNGTNTMQLVTTVRQSDTLNNDTPSIVFSNAPQTIVISNFVTYTNWNDYIPGSGSNYTFNAQSTATNVDWEIDIYDQYGDFVNSQTNYSADGNISWTWNLTDYTGASRANPDNDPVFFPYINITASAGDPGGWMPPVNGSFPSSGSWIFAYLDNDFDDGTTNYAGADEYYTTGIHGMEAGPNLFSITTHDYPIKFGRVYDQATRNASWTNLENLLSWFPIRNFYYYGHGSPNSIGGDISTLDSSNNITGATILTNSAAFLTSQWVHDNVTYKKYGSSNPFRFVWLDGCSTAAGNWASAWGVPNQPEPLSFYYDTTNNPTRARPSVFCGWDVDTGGDGWGTVRGAWQFRKSWMGYWANSDDQESLAQAFQDANTASGWIDQQHLNHLKIYGYSSMGFFDYNNSSDWP